MYDLPIGGKLVSFADDTALIVKGSGSVQVYEQIKKDISLINKWLQVHNLRLNIEKTKIIPFTINKRTLPHEQNIMIERCQNCNTNCECKLNK